MICRTANFGNVSPYFIGNAQPQRVYLTAEEAILAVPPAERIVDPVGILEIFNFHHMCGMRTLVPSVKKMPWRAELMEDGTIARLPPIPHGLAHMDPAEAARELCRLLEAELLEAIGSRKKVYLLLTGGYDSRMVAGVLHRARQQIRAEIVVVSWGFEKSRDVQYARRLAEGFGWDFVHVPYGADWTWKNVECMATWGGAEIAGTHLHAMNWFEHAAKDDLVIAASYGDSIGRAEFSGVHLLNLQGPRLQNNAQLIHPFLEEECFRQAREDIASSWALVADGPDCIKWEHHQQENYMRRWIGHAMDRIRVFTGFHQAFTSDPVVGFMWGLCPFMRDGAIYAQAFKQLDARLYSLPWARTGVAPDGTTKETDPELLTDYHDYERWCRNELAERLEAHAFNGELYKLGFLFAPAWNRLYRHWKSYRGAKATGAIRNVVVLAQFDLARQRFGLLPCRPGHYWRDRVRSLAWPVIHGIRSGFGGSRRT